MGDSQSGVQLRAFGAERAPSPHGASADVRGLVLALLRERAPSSDAARFRLRRARTMAEELHPAERDVVVPLLSTFEEHGTASGELLDPLVCWAGGLEARGLVDESCDVLHASLRLHPSDAQTVLHAARLARKAGRVLEARSFYDRVTQLQPGGSLRLMAAIGHALLTDTPEDELGSVLRSALKVGDMEAAAVAQQERARARRARGDVPGALRDYVTAGARYVDPIDRGLVCHEVADMLIMRGDLEGAREALLEATRYGHPEQAAHARTRLHGIARAQGDVLGLRRYADAAPTALVSMAPRPRRGTRARLGATALRGLSRVRGLSTD